MASANPMDETKTTEEIAAARAELQRKSTEELFASALGFLLWSEP